MSWVTRNQLGSSLGFPLCAVSPGAADAFLSGLIKPRMPLRVAFDDETTGSRLGPVDTLELLTRDVLQRGSLAELGDQGFSRAVVREVRAMRVAAMEETRREKDVPFDIELIQELTRRMRKNRRSVHLPRDVFGANPEAAVVLTWAVVNLAAVLGLVASSWLREIAPLRKAGPEVVTDVRNLRPVGYMDDLAGVFDGAWLSLEQQKLEAYTGATQGGGKYDAVLMTLGIVIAMQMRRNMNLPTLLEKCDLLFGFDLAWRDGTRLHIGRAGVRGRMWLVADAAMDEDRFRVRLGPLVGALAVLRGVGIG